MAVYDLDGNMLAESVIYPSLSMFQSIGIIGDSFASGEVWIGENYSDYLIWLTDTEPTFEIGSRPRLYGTCIGPYQIQSEEGAVSYPSFDLVLVEQ